VLGKLQGRTAMTDGEIRLAKGTIGTALKFGLQLAVSKLVHEVKGARADLYVRFPVLSRGNAAE
jgi:hypothetical protein